MTLRSLPKIELHLHHEGAAPPAFIKRLAQEKSVDLSGIFDASGAYKFSDFMDFLNVYEAATQVLQSPEDFYRLTTAILDESAAHGVIYSETFISPDFCGGGDLGAWREYLCAIQEATDVAEKKHGILLRGVVTCIRHFGPDMARNAALCAAETAGDWIVGFGMGGDETAGKQGDFSYAFDMAREAGLHLTTHAGEWGGPDEIRDAIRDLNVARIGHGVRAAEDADLMVELADRGIVLEVCPNSNIALGIFPDMGAHPIARLRDAGVKVTVSTDDPPFFNTTMTDEYTKLARAFGWDATDFRALNETAAKAAFCGAETRALLLKRLETQ